MDRSYNRFARLIYVFVRQLFCFRFGLASFFLFVLKASAGNLSLKLKEGKKFREGGPYS